MPNAALSADTLHLVEYLFRPQHRAAVILILEGECGADLPFMGGATPESLERIRFAVLRLSEGSPSKVAEAVALAKTDWRDVLVAAQFANGLQAHVAWFRELGATQG
ncbi:MAG: hypothetical protein HC936_03760 [Leptolyngbyaceae cyanobacterium SU_3_3]|nr:hypothetical protein [Leptolyngbyaceae cyanobacterium SU_3_3]